MDPLSGNIDIHSVDERAEGLELTGPVTTFAPNDPVFMRPDGSSVPNAFPNALPNALCLRCLEQLRWPDGHPPTHNILWCLELSKYPPLFQ